MTRIPHRPRLLNPSEVRVLLDAALGLTATQSAEKRGIKVNSVVELRRAGTHALGAHNITHAVALLLAHGIVDADKVRTAHTKGKH